MLSNSVCKDVFVSKYGGTDTCWLVAFLFSSFEVMSNLLYPVPFN